MEVPLKDSPSNMSDEKEEEEEGVAPPHHQQGSTVYEKESALFNFPMKTPRGIPSNQSRVDFLLPTLLEYQNILELGLSVSC